MTVAADGKPKDSGVPGEHEGVDYREISENPDTNSVERTWFGDVVELLGPPAVLLDRQCHTVSANARFCEFARTTRGSLIGRHIGRVCGALLDLSELQQTLLAFEVGRKRINLPVTGRQPVAASVWRLPVALGRAMALLVIDGVGADERSMPSKKLRDGSSSDRGPLSIEALHHDLRQPLQTLSVLQGILAVREEEPALRKHIVRLNEAIEALSGILNILDDLERPNGGSVQPRFVGFSVSQVLNRLKSEFTYHAEARGLSMRVVQSRAVVHSDPRRLEQTIRALLLVATKMVKHGKILLGCRRRPDKISIEVWIDGETIPSEQQQAILNEFHRSAALPSERGIARSIVQPLSDRLGLSLKARSRPGIGLLFTADVPTSPISQSIIVGDTALRAAEEVAARGTIALVSDRPSEREELTLLLKATGHQVVSVPHDGGARLEGNAGMQPEIIVGDFSRSADHGARVIEELRRLLGSHTPAMVIADEAWRAAHSSSIDEPVTYLSKPATAEAITGQLTQLFATVRQRLSTSRIKDHRKPHQTTFVVEDDRMVSEAISALLRARGEQVELYPSGERFLEAYTPFRRGCLVVDDKLPGMRGVELLEKLRAGGATLPAIMITGHGDITTAVRAMKAGAIDYMEKPVFHERLLSAVDHALEIDQGSADSLARRQQLASRFAALTHRERQVLDLVVKGASSKSIARVLNISQRTVENHRAAVMKRLGATSLSDLIRIVMQVGSSREL